MAITKVEHLVNDVVVSTQTNAPFTPFSSTRLASELGEGSHTITAKVYEDGSNTASHTSAPITLTVAATAQPYLLDQYPNAKAAYSLDDLTTAYTGDSIIAEKTGGVRQAIGTVNGVFDVDSLMTFAGSDTVKVFTLHDKSGNGKDFIQNDFAKQPIIVDAGTLVTTTGGLPALDFTGSNILINTSPSYWEFLVNGDNNYLNAIMSIAPISERTFISNRYSGAENYFEIKPNGTNGSMHIAAGKNSLYSNRSGTDTGTATDDLFATDTDFMFSHFADPDNATAAERSHLRSTAKGIVAKNNTLSGAVYAGGVTTNLGLGGSGGGTNGTPSFVGKLHQLVIWGAAGHTPDDVDSFVNTKYQLY
jgi:hypothetical protein